jgi:hypothetical protein
MQTGSSETLIGWKSRKTTYVPVWDRICRESVAMDSGLTGVHTEVGDREGIPLQIARWSKVVLNWFECMESTFS